MVSRSPMAFLPFRGRLFKWAVSIVAPSVASVVSMLTALPTTLTVCASRPTSNFTSTRIFWATGTNTSDRMNDWNPCASTEIE